MILSSSKNLQLLCIFPYVVLVCYQYDVCENSVGSVYIGGYSCLCELCPVSFPVVLL